MAAYAALLSVKFIINQIQQHPSPPISLDQQQLCSLNQNLTFLENFLEAHSIEEDDRLETLIADAAYAAEDVIETHIVDQIHAGSTGSSHGENTSSIDFYQSLERVIQDMDSIKNEVINMGATQHHQLTSMKSSVSIGPERPVSSMQNNTMVDFGDILIHVMDKLTRKDSNLVIVPIVGMGGMGKTTLAISIYSHPLIVQHFHFRAWVAISQDYSVTQILLQVLLEESTGEKVHELGERVYKQLWGRRYLIVMDDIWSIKAWDKVKTYFPNNNNGSRIMMTTRLSHLAFQLSGSHDFQMNFLDKDRSWDLLREIVFGKEGCHVELEDIGKEIARKCRGLPLSIVVIGGVLAKSNKTREYWDYTSKNLNSQINLDDNEHCLQILDTSYKELPIHLKPCFLYMGVFPEDHVIYVPDLVKLLVAEGFLKPIKNKSLEEVAREYVKELIDRNLILVHELRWHKETRSCKIHDLLRDLCLREGRKQRFMCVLRRHNLNIPKDMYMERRISIHDENVGKQISRPFIYAVKSAPLTRSLIVFGRGFFRAPPSSTCRLLRVHSCVNYNNRFLKGRGGAEALFQQANLRYLSVDCVVEAQGFPTSLYLLWNLQTLDGHIFRPKLSGTAIEPSEIWKMCHLRHVKFYKSQLSNPPGGEDDIVLENLQTLSRIEDFVCSEEVVKRIPNVKKLRLSYKIKGLLLPNFCLNSLGCLRNLTSLYLGLDHDGSPDYADLGTMRNLNFPCSLKKLSLYETKLLWKDLNAKIGSLPHLEVLKLLDDSCVGPNWETTEGQFRSLKFFLIEWTDLKCWITDNTHFPRLEHLHLCGLFKLEEIPLSIGDIPTLQSIQLLNCHESVNASAERIKEEQLSYGNEDLHVKIEKKPSKEMMEDHVFWGV